MNKKILGFALLLGLFATLGACDTGGTGDTTPGASPADPAAPAAPDASPSPSP